MATKVHNPANRAEKVELGTDGEGDFVDFFGVFKLYLFTTAITAGVTATTSAAGSLGRTSHATGRASIFVSDGANWQYLTNA